MLFTTAIFFLAFLPVTWVGFFVLGRRSPSQAALWLLLASLFFYSWWLPEFTLLLLASISLNFFVGTRISAAVQEPRGQTAARAWLTLGIVFNLALLGWFKYANFFVGNLNAALGTTWELGRIVLPIGISFYSFTQIAFLVDCQRHKLHEYRLVHYGLFVTFFPHLIAGPVLHHGQMMPQFADPAVYRPQTGRIIAGLCIFALGLFKKVVMADGVAPYADAVFRPADAGLTPDTAEAWLGALAYSLQLYFDFSGYSDMAIGLSWLFNIRLPFNFDSPYRACNISDFWRRWHISLSTFLRDYLYIALGGNRHGSLRRYVNLALTMVLGGLWHGASWLFVIWGALHGAYLMLNLSFRALCGPVWGARLAQSRSFGVAAWALTMLAVVVAWVFFRAETLPGAMRMLQAMLSFGAPAPVTPASHAMLWNAGLSAPIGWLWCTVLGAVACLAPNSNHIGTALLARADRPGLLRLGLAGFAGSAALLIVLLNTARDSVSAFIYFNF